MYKEIIAKNALHHHGRTFATNWDLNIYRGCSHRCKYCFAQYSHKFLNNGDEPGFFDDIFVKTNIAEVLDKELSKKSWNGDPIQICGVTDCYQPIEKKYGLMRKVLEVMIKHKQSVSILTKSPLILRDYDLLNELSKVAYVDLATTITTLNEDIKRKIEPGTFSSMERLEAMKELSKIDSEISVLFMPIIPYLTDNTKDIELVFKVAKEHEINNIISGSLHLRGNLKKNFYNFLKQDFPETYQKISKLYNGAYASKEYREKLNDFLRKMRIKYRLKKFTKKNMILIDNEQKSMSGTQMELF